ncbi:MAG: hypothetical protein F6J90_24010 [Moorea sp. SIOASIH]|nr:hypothetical protein [Moorena sp. SIOASIH]NEO39233.1 hypothetical protein [Moorena sp. SIOASIH]NEO93013.1 hypothetical protein [Moorena sp. SIO3G5]
MPWRADRVGLDLPKEQAKIHEGSMAVKRVWALRSDRYSFCGKRSLFS